MRKSTIASFGAMQPPARVAGERWIPPTWPLAVLASFSLGLGTSSCGDGNANIAGVGAADLARLQAAGNDRQVGTVGAVLPAPLTVHAVGPAGEVVGGVSVHWTFSSGGGSTTVDGQSVPELTTITDNTGWTSVYWQLGTAAGDQVATATLVTANQRSSPSHIKFHSHGNAGRPASVSVSPDFVTLAAGDSATLAATVRDRWGNTTSSAGVSWSSSDPSVASVGSGGTVTGLTKGKATITAIDGKAAGTASVTVSATASAEHQNATLTLVPDSVSLASIGATARLSAVAKDSMGNNMSHPDFSWRSLASSIASVSNSGLVTARAVGATLIVVTATCCTGADTAMVVVSQVPQRVMINPDSLSLQVGKSSLLSATVLDANDNIIAEAPITWSSSQDSVASVDPTGLVMAKTAGAAMIMAAVGPSAASSVSAEASVFVSAPTTAIPGTVNDLRLASATDSTVTLRWTQVDDGTGSPANYALRYGTPTLFWGSASATEVSVSGTSIGVSQTHAFAGLQPGTNYQFQLVPYRGTLNAAAVFGGFSNVASGSTTAPGTFQTPTVTVTPAFLSLASVGDTAQLLAVARDSMGNIVANPGFTWTSIASSIAAVTNSGLVTAKALGTTAIIVTATCCGTDTVPSSVGHVQSVAHPNEPTGFAKITERGFDALDEDGWTHSENASPGFDITTDGTAEQGGGVGRITYPQGWSPRGVQPPGIARYSLSTPVRSLYVAFWFKVSDNWQGSSAGVQKILYITDGTYPGGGNPMFFGFLGGGSHSLTFEIFEQGNIARNFDENVGHVELVRGQWHFVEMVLTMNSSGSASDGTAELWVDGTKTANYRDVRWEDESGGRTWDNVRWEPIWGGMGTVPVASTMYQYIDYIYVSGR